MSLNEPREAMLMVSSTQAEHRLSDDERAILHAYRLGALGPLPAQPRRSALRWLLAAIGGTVGLLLVVILVVVLMTLVQFVTVTNQTAGSLTDRANQAVAATGQTVGSLAQNVADRFNPTHPPRTVLAQDAEFESLRVVRPGDVIGETGEYVLTLEAIRRREGQVTADTAQYAVVKRAYRAPRETKVLGFTVRVDRGEAEHYLDKGEAFRIGRDVYKTNWVSTERNQAAFAQYRTPASATSLLDFAYD
jgi:hypothetical protein